jgi:MFS family permease
MLNGAAFASWVVRIPDVQQRLDLSEATLGLSLFGASLGGLIAMPVSAALVGRYGSRPVALGAALWVAATTAGPAHAPSALSLAVILAALGIANSVMVVALNTQASAIERQMGRPIMAGLHAFYSLGGLMGAGAGGLVAGAGVGPGRHLGFAGLAVAALAPAITRFLLPPGLDNALASTARAAPARALVLLGVVAFCVLFSEGAVADWSSIYLRDVAGAGPALSAAGYAAFSLMMATGRFAGNALTVRLGAARLVRVGGATAAAGVALAVAQSHPWFTVLGFGAVGAGLASVYPTILAAAGRTGPSASGSIALVSGIGYTGFLAGPPLIGMVGEALSLRAGVGIIGLAGLLIAVLAAVLCMEPLCTRPPRRAPGELMSTSCG